MFPAAAAAMKKSPRTTDSESCSDSLAWRRRRNRSRAQSRERRETDHPGYAATFQLTRRCEKTACDSACLKVAPDFPAIASRPRQTSKPGSGEQLRFESDA